MSHRNRLSLACVLGMLPLLSACALAAGTGDELGGAGGDEAQPGGGGTGGGASGLFSLGLSAPSGDLVPGASLEAALFKEGIRVESGVEWKVTPRLGLSDRRGWAGVTVGGCGACARIQATRISGNAANPERDGFAEMDLVATYAGETLTRTLRLHDVGATALVGGGTLALVATGPVSQFDADGAGLQGLSAHGSVILALDLAAADERGAPIVNTAFVQHEGTLAKLADDPLSAGFSVAGLTGDGKTLVRVIEEEGKLTASSVAAADLGFETLDAVLVVPAADCEGSRLVVASGNEATTVTAELQVGTTLTVKGLAGADRVVKLFSGTSPDGTGELVGFAVGSDGQVHPVQSPGGCNAGGGSPFATPQPCEASYAGPVEGGIADAVFVREELVATTGLSAYYSQSYSTCEDNAEVAAGDEGCTLAPAGLGAGSEVAYGSIGVCGFQTVQLKQDPALAAQLSLGRPCVVCAIEVDESGKPTAGDPLDVRSVRPFTAADGTERLLVIGAPGQAARVVDAPVNEVCPDSCTVP